MDRADATLTDARISSTHWVNFKKIFVKEVGDLVNFELNIVIFEKRFMEHFLTENIVFFFFLVVI